MKRKLSVLGVFAAVIGWLSVAQAQQEVYSRGVALGIGPRTQEEVFQRGIEFGIGARALGMGGAYIGIGDDYSASFWNPAALTQIRRLEGFGTLSHAQQKNDATLGNFRFDDDLSSTRLNSIGFAYPVPTYQGSLVFSLGYHHIHPYDASLKFSWFNPLPQDRTTQTWSVLEEGSLNNWVFAGAIEVAPNVSIGAALNYWTGKHDYRFSFTDIDYENFVSDFREARRTSIVNFNYSGFNVKFGGLYRPLPFVRLGLTLSTPVYISGTDTWKVDDSDFDDDDSVFVFQDDDAIDFKIRSPLSLAAGGAVNLAWLLLSGSIEWTDWSQTRYSTDPPVAITKDIALDDEESLANDSLRANYRNTLRLRLGAEFTLPILDLQFRAGYFFDPSPLNGLPEDDFTMPFVGALFNKKAGDREFFTAGLGIFLDKQTRLDLAYLRGEWTDASILDDFSDDLYPISEKKTVNKVLASLAFRF
jgi:long-subunit fatty acid transport protein